MEELHIAAVAVPKVGGGEVAGGSSLLLESAVRGRFGDLGRDSAPVLEEGEGVEGELRIRLCDCSEWVR